MKLDAASLLGLLPKLGSAIEAGAAAYGAAKAAGLALTPDLVAAAISAHLAGWAPQIKGKAVLDDETRTALCRFLAGVVFNFLR